MMRFPDISADQIVFVYADDLWLVSREGGTATPLAGPPGVESYPRFSPSGDRVAFAANYDGNSELYVLPTKGGLPNRVTHHPSREVPCSWMDDGTLVFTASGMAGLPKLPVLFQVPATGGLPEQLPVPYGAFGSVNETGEWLAYVPNTRDTRSWKRYRGGMASDIWLFHLKDNTSKRMTDWEGTDSLPMWHGSKVYYLSDAGPNHRLNLWSYDVTNEERTQVTSFADYDVKWPSIGPGPAGQGEIIFQYGSRLHVCDLGSGEVRRVEIEIPGARPTLRARRVDASEYVVHGAAAPEGQRIAVEARGDIWTLPAEHGAPRNLTRSSGIAERDPNWSPDGRWIVYLSDQTGEYELYRMRSDGKGKPERLTQDGAAYRYSPTWSPDSKSIVFADKSGAYFLHDVESGETKHFDSDPWATDPSNPGFSFSSDSRFITYSRPDDSTDLSSIYIYSMETGEVKRVTSSMFNDEDPAFDREGKYLAFTSNRHFAPEYGDLDSSFIYAGTGMLLLVPLSAETESPFAPESDEVTWEDEEEESDEGDESAEDAEESGDGEEEDESEDEEPIEIDFEGFEARAMALPVKPGNFGNLAFGDGGKLLYIRVPARGQDGEPSIKIFDFDADEPEEKTVFGGAG
ncbi:MAG: hypothetical protein AAF368_04875, partial [Planctomycetota bacterium]